MVKRVIENLSDFHHLHTALSSLNIQPVVPSEVIMPIHLGAHV